MGRLVLSKTQGEGFLRRVRAALGGGWERVAGVAGVQPRTILDWARGRWQISYEAALRLEAHSGVPVPAGATVLPEFWSTSKAATARNFRWNAVQVDMPEWIKADARLARACVRGLVDTDGCIYIH
ncbi:MAG: helix-turn-helix transcriptional regulator, partial [Candidatus Rokubacteria bacterium]|nr:helix-turn-helix transcriptional regulator [Candidatus Rokubacteria bacterium]